MSSITDPLVLPADLVFVPVAELPNDIQQQLEYEEGDIAVTRLRSRIPSKVVNNNMASLLEQFRTEKTIVEAILRFSINNEADPKETLHEVFPLIQQFVNEQLLLPTDAPGLAEIEATMAPGDRINSFTIVRLVQVLQDTEVYQARSVNNFPVVIKLMRTKADPMTVYLLDNEEAVLRHLDNQTNPSLIEAGEIEERRYLAMAWCEGLSADVVAQEIRDQPRFVNKTRLLELCVAILEAYEHLHDQQVIHADVHPRNILVSAEGQVTLIDFGLAYMNDPSHTKPRLGRGGVAFFFEPEYARARLNNQKLPPPNVKGEQYALAALCYYLLTGVHYLVFSLEEERMLRQITSEPPLSFEEQGIESWPVVEHILTRALSKLPEDRFADVTEFAARLKDILRASKIENNLELMPAPKVLDLASEALLDEILQLSGWDGTWFEHGIEKSPTVSVNYGSAGIAYWLYRMASVQGKPSLLALADIWVSRAIRNLENEGGLYNSDIEITQETVGHISPYHTKSGVFAVQALISQAMGDRVTQNNSIRAFVGAINWPCDNLDLTLGWSGVLLIGALLYESLIDKGMAEDNGLLDLGERALDRVWSVIDTYAPIAEAKEQMDVLGIAHGWAGVLYGSLRWCQATETSLPSEFRKRLDQLADCAEPIGRGIRWPWQIGMRRPVYMPGWCNGTSGYIFLWSLAHNLLGDRTYYRLAEKSAWNIWEDPAQSVNLCCGLAGRGYGLLHWNKYTDNPVWLERSYILANRAASYIRSGHIDVEPGYAHSLYKGEVGVAALLSDLEYPNLAVFPFFESEGWHLKDSNPGRIDS